MAENEEVTKVWDLPCKSREFGEPPRLSQRGDQIDLVYDCERGQGDDGQATITFQGVEAFSFTAFENCSIEQVAAYDKVVVLITSDWLKELHARRTVSGRFVRHYRVFFDAVGSYDVIASTFVPPENAD